MEQAWPRWLTIAGVAAASFHHRKIGGPQPAVVGVFPIPASYSPPVRIGLAANVRPARLTVDCSRMNRIGSLELENGAAVNANEPLIEPETAKQNPVEAPAFSSVQVLAQEAAAGGRAGHEPADTVN